MSEKITGMSRKDALTYLDKTLRLTQVTRQEALMYIDSNYGRWYFGQGWKVRRDENSYTIETT